MIKSEQSWGISIVVPILNEAGEMHVLLAHLLSLQHKGCQIIVVDGGSDDDSIALVKAAGFSVISTSRGRACQMNAGAQAADKDFLLFLHADTRLPDSFDTLLCNALVDEGADWGRFDVSIEGEPLMLKTISWCINCRSRLTGIATGDQAIFVSRHAFESVGGFPEQPLMEDIELSKRLKKHSAPFCARHKVTTSGRRWIENGVWRTVWLMWQLRLAYWLGVPADKLIGRYR